MLNKIKILCSKKQINLLTVLLFGSVIAVFFEFLGIGSIPIFAMIIVDLNILKEKLPSFINTDILNELNQNEITTIRILVICMGQFVDLFFCSHTMHKNNKIKISFVERII